MLEIEELFLLFFKFNCYNKWGRGDLNLGSLHSGNQAMPLTYKALGTEELSLLEIGNIYIYILDK